MPEPIKVGVMGCAAIAKRSMIPTLQSVDGFEVTALSSRTSRKAEEFAGIFHCSPVVGYDALLERDDIDAVYMPLPTGLHHEWIIKCLEAGKHVLAEKSIAHDFRSAQEMVALARAKGFALMENYMFQYHSQHEFVRDQLTAGAVGDIRIFRADFGFPPLDKDNFRYDEAIGGGALLDAAGYTVRGTHFMLGEEFKVSAATLHIDPQTGTSIWGSAFLDNGRDVSSQIGFGFDNFYQCKYEIWGSKGRLIAEKAFTARPDFRPTIVIERQGERLEHQTAADDHFAGSAREFLRIIREHDAEKHYAQILLQSRTLEDIRQKSRQPE